MEKWLAHIFVSNKHIEYGDIEAETKAQAEQMAYSMAEKEFSEKDICLNNKYVEIYVSRLNGYTKNKQ